MAKTGCALILFAVFLIGAFVADQFLFQDKSGLEVQDRFQPLDDGTEELDPALQDPELYAPSIADDISSERFILSADELKLALEGSDYEYTIKEGDTIDELARKYLGRHELKSLLFEENPDLIRGGKLDAGTKITIPFRHRIR